MQREVGDTVVWQARRARLWRPCQTPTLFRECRSVAMSAAIGGSWTTGPNPLLNFYLSKSHRKDAFPSSQHEAARMPGTTGLATWEALIPCEMQRQHAYWLWEHMGGSDPLWNAKATRLLVVGRIS
jgi:hypothetical protein